VFAADNALHFQELDLQTMKPAGSPLVLTDHVAVYLGNSGRAAFSVSNAGPIAYRKSIAARRRVLWRDVLGKETSIGIQTPAANLTGTPRFSSNGHDVSFARNDDAFSSGIDVLNTDTGEFRNVEVGVNLFSGASPIWSSDGMFLAFAVQVGPVFQLFQQGIGTGPYGRTRILSSDESSLPTDWHGEFLLFTRTSTTSKGNVMVLSVPDGTEPIPIAATDAQEGNARFSPNGKWIVYESDELNGHYEIFVQPFPGTTNERRKVSSSGGTKAQWSWDGTSIYFLSPDGLLMAAGFTTSADGRDAVVKTPVSLFSVPVDSTYAPAPDGRFLMSEPTDSVPPIYVLPNPFGAKK
jgi:Tol biopolymer transport system component